MKKFLIPAITLFVSAILATQAYAIAIDLGDASQYSAFIKTNYKVSGTDTEGRVAIGGDLTVYGGHDIGAEITNLNMGAGPSLVVGGNIVKESSQWGGNGAFNVYKDHPSVLGDAVYSGKIIDNSVVTPDSGRGSIAGNFSQVTKANLPVDFDSAFAHLNKLSTDLMAMTANGIVEQAIGNDGKITGPLTFKPKSNVAPSDNVYIFDVTQEQINSTEGWFVEDVSDDATIIFNVTNDNAIESNQNWGGNKDTCAEGQDGCVHLSQTNLSINGKTAFSHFDGKGKQPTNKGAYKNTTMTNNILFNFGNATQVNLASDMYGSVLAPNADIKANPSVIWGQVIGKSWEGNMQINYNPFSSVGSTPPGPTPVPTPETIWLFVLAFALLYVNRKPFIRVKRKSVAEKSEADTAPKALTNNSVTA